MHTEVHSETGRVIVISDIPDNEPQAFTVAIKDPADWQEMHDYIINENEIDGIPNRRIDCTAEMPFSTKRAVYQISVEEAEVLRQHPKVEWVEESSRYNPTCLEQRKYDEDFDRHIDTNRFKDSGIRHKRAGGDPTPVDNSLLDFTQWGLHRHGYKNDPFGSETDVSADIRYALTGKNVDVVIMDTGIRWDHPEFLKPGVTSFVDKNSTRVRDILIHGASEYGIDWEAEGLVSPGSSPYTNYTVANVLESSSFNGSWHGSHVGGTAAGNQFGAAFEANIWTIACVDRSDVGWAEPSDGFDYIKVWHKNKPINPETGRKNPTIVNCSWGHRQFVRDNLSSSATFRGTTYTDGGDEYLGEAYDSIYFLDRNSSYFEFTTRRVSGQTTMDELLDDPDCQDIIFICSAGNSKSKQDTIGGIDYDNEFLTGTFYFSTSGYDSYWCRGGTPAVGHEGKPDAVISVASLSEYYSIGQETLDDYTSRGPRTDIIAAGGDILCPWSSGYADPRDFSFYLNYLQGTSMAAPNVTGVVALYLESYPDATRVDARNWLLEHGSVLAPLRDSESDFTQRNYWGSPSALRDTNPRVLFNPFANNERVSIEGVTLEGINLSYE
jgi:subtilisin family serine protease